MNLNFTEPLQLALSRFFGYLPQLLGAVIILFVGYFVALFVKKIVTTVLTETRFDRAIQAAPGGMYTTRIMPNPSRFVGSVAFWLVWLGVISLAVSALDISALSALVAAIYSYIPSVIKAILIFLVASAISAGAVTFVKQIMGRTPLANIIATVVPAITLSIATFMILNELNIAKDIVNITYTAIMAALALGLGLSFGLGSKDVMSEILRNAYAGSQKNISQAKADMARAKQNTKNMVHDSKHDPRV